MTTFDHVTDPAFLALLRGELSFDACDAALESATLCYQQDQLSELVSFERTHVQAAALDAAEAFLQRNYLEGVAANLRIFWAV